MDANKKRKSTFGDDSYRPKKKSRRYDDSYSDFGFTFVLQNGEEKLQCVIWSKVLASESTLPNKLKRHLGSSHPQFINKPRVFSRKLNDLKKQVSTVSQFTQLPSKALLAFYQVAQRIAKC